MTPGSASDIAMRLVAQKLTEAWGQQVIVDNRPGANQIIGAEHGGESKPDGYTLLSGVPSMLTMNQVVYKKLPYDTLRDFDAVTQIATNHFALIVNPSLPATSVAALVKLAKSRPGEMLYGSPGSAISSTWRWRCSRTLPASKSCTFRTRARRPAVSVSWAAR